MTHTPITALTSNINGLSMNLKLQEYMNNLSGFISAFEAPPQVNIAVIRRFMNEDKEVDDDQAIFRCWKW